MDTICPGSASYLTPKLSYPNAPFLTVNVPATQGKFKMNRQEIVMDHL